MRTLMSDVTYGLRMLRKTPVFTGVAVLSLALGVGASTALYSVADAVLLRMLSVRNPEQLVLFDWQAGKPFRTTGIRGTFVPGGYPEGMRGSSSFQARLVALLRERQQADPNSPLASVFAFSDLEDASVVADAQAELVPVQVVSGNYFSSLGVNAALGRLIGEDDDKDTASPAAVISYAYWRDRFGSSPSIVGKQIKVNQVDFTVIGVTPRSFEAPAQAGVVPTISMPIAFEPRLESERPMVDKPERLAPWWLLVMGRLKPGATIAQAQASLDGPFSALALEIMPAPTKPDEQATLAPKDHPHLLLRPGGRGLWEMRSVYAPKIYLLFGVVGLVLVLACANVANLLLTRAAQRAPEVTVRLAMGASRGRLMRQMLTESLLLSCLGGAMGALLAVWGKDVLHAVGALGSLLPVELNYVLNGRVLAFTGGVSVLTGVLFGVAPAWRSAHLDLAPALKESGKAGAVAARSWLSKSLVVAQVAISLVLLMGAGLFVRTLVNLQGLDVGFNQENLLNFGLRPAGGGYTGERINQFYGRIAERLDALPGVKSATFAQMPLLARYLYGYGLLLPGEGRHPVTSHSTNLLVVRENYLQTMEIPLLKGRAFSPQDTQAGLKVAIINETLAAKYFNGQDPIGRSVGFDEDGAGRYEIVGVARDIKYNRQREDKEALIFIPWRQWLEPMGEMTFSLRGAGDSSKLGAAVRETIRSVDAALPVVRMSSQLSQSAETLAEERMYARLVSFFGALALLLAGIGIYGVMSYSVTQRTGEIGIRMALGARAGSVVRLILGQAFALVGAGALVGGLAALALRRVVASQLYGVGAADPVTFAGVSAVLLSAALIACWPPARRASRVDPLKALRCE